MNYANYKKIRRKHLIKTGIYIFFILAFAMGATYYIYHSLEDENKEIRSSESLDVVFNEKNGEVVTIKKVRPVTDAIGLSSRAYTFTIKNNNNTRVNYDIKIVSDDDVILEDECGDKQIPLNIIKAGIHERGKVSDIYNLDDLKDGLLVSTSIGPKKEVDYTIRFWISNNNLIVDSQLHFHGRIVVVENGTDVASSI